jgi:hypothetical protein
MQRPQVSALKKGLGAQFLKFRAALGCRTAGGQLTPGRLKIVKQL